MRLGRGRDNGRRSSGGGGTLGGLLSSLSFGRLVLGRLLFHPFLEGGLELGLEVIKGTESCGPGVSNTDAAVMDWFFARKEKKDREKQSR